MSSLSLNKITSSTNRNTTLRMLMVCKILIQSSDLRLFGAFLKSGTIKNSSLKCMLATSSLKDAILLETEECCAHLTPELKLQLITENCRLWSAKPIDSPFHDPYWAFYWPGGQAVSRYILDNPVVVRGKSVLDFGCGCGACGLAAKLSKASKIIFNDIDPVALDAVQINSNKNQLNMDEGTTQNLVGTDHIGVDVLLAGDMFYEEEFAEIVLKWLEKAHQKGITILLGDPGRIELDSHPIKSSLRCIARYHLLPSTSLENKGFTEAFVWTFK